ncbi:MAG TPA: glycoside hydrolase family 16 protein [Planctomycetota bacterium]|jgi:beta-glucanase (GH16 family)
MRTAAIRQACKHAALIFLCSVFGATLAAADAAAVQPKLEKEASQWELTFHDEFDEEKLDTRVWDVESAAPGHIQSSRWPENVQVGGGICRFLTKKEQRGGKDWTTASIWTHSFKQQYGYFEARMKIGAASGLNNAFWLMTRNKKTDPVHFEIDICEAHYPDKVPMNLHNWAGEHWAKSETWKAPEDLSKEFHVYGLEWTESELIWTFDGKPIRHLKHTICKDAAPVRLSTAVFPWAGKVSDALDGTSMDVDWVRVYKRR